MRSVLSFLQRPKIKLVLQFLVVWIVLFGARTFHFNGFANNEVDVLPSALQTVNENWLPNDWYLNLEIGYRHFFNELAGPLVSWLGFKYGALVGRALLYLLFAGATLSFIRSFRINFAMGLLALLPFLSNQSLIAGEWMVGGAETKAFAYAFILFSLSALYRKRWLFGFAFAGAALSFHVLVGIYGLFCAVIAIVLSDKQARASWQSVLKKSWPFFLTGLWGLYAIVNQFFLDHGVNASEAWSIYIHYRVPHHVFPGAWDAWDRLIILGAGVLLTGSAALFGRSRNLRFLGFYALGSLTLFAIGLVVYAIGATDLLRYYWFRFPDTMMPFLTAMVAALLASNLLKGTSVWGEQPNDPEQKSMKRSPTTRNVLLAGQALTILCVLIIVGLRIHSRFPGIEDASAQGWGDPQARPMLQWIKEHTPDDAIILADPTMKSFYVQAERAMLVSFKHSPQSAPDILEWYCRLTLCNGNIPPSRKHSDPLEELQKNFYALDEASIQHIARLYGTTFYLGKSGHPLSFQQVHTTSGFILYQIDL